MVVRCVPRLSRSSQEIWGWKSGLQNGMCWHALDRYRSEKSHLLRAPLQEVGSEWALHSGKTKRLQALAHEVPVRRQGKAHVLWAVSVDFAEGSP